MRGQYWPTKLESSKGNHDSKSPRAGEHVLGEVGSFANSSVKIPLLPDLVSNAGGSMDVRQSYFYLPKWLPRFSRDVRMIKETLF